MNQLYVGPTNTCILCGKAAHQHDEGCPISALEWRADLSHLHIHPSGNYAVFIGWAWYCGRPYLDAYYKIVDGSFIDIGDSDVGAVEEMPDDVRAWLYAGGKDVNYLMSLSSTR